MALKLMRTAADLEDNSEKHIAMENRLYRCANCWVTCCSNSNSREPALTEYETSLVSTPKPAARLVRRSQGRESR